MMLYPVSCLFSVLNSDDYILEISRVGRQDQGLYECQINMIPLKAFIVKLIVKGQI